MPLPQINESDISSLIPGLDNIEFLAQGGQKVVYSCEKDGNPFVLKFLLVEASQPNQDTITDEDTIPALDAVTARAMREVNTMSSIDIPTLVKLGPITLNSARVRGQSLLYFSEEKIEGRNLEQILGEETRLSVSDVIQLANDIGAAIEAIWELRRIHRDIKPSNIVKREVDGRFILLDVGLVFDLYDISLTAPFFVVGTKMYLSPDQMDYGNKRRLDFRSDLFALGIVLYESVTGIHPFALDCSTTTELLARIRSSRPQLPSELRSDIPPKLEEIILRLLEKVPHLRFRSCRHFSGYLKQVEMP